MKLFEFEAKDLFRRSGISIPLGYVVHNPEEAEAIARGIGKPVVLKAQVLVAGRGKSGGVRFANDATEAGSVASDLIGSTINERRVDLLLVEEKLDIVQQFYAAVTIDRHVRTHVVLASTTGGVDIEEIAQTNPASILRCWVDPDVGFSKADATGMLSAFSLSDNDLSNFASILSILYKVSIEHDGELVEINPLVKTPSGKFIAADARLIADDNALFRNSIFRVKSFQRGEDTPREAEARKHNLAYVDLDGDIGIIGNGAGLVMSTIDMVELYGGQPANFLDIGGGAKTETVKNGVILVMSKPEVRAVLVNIVGGITRCDVVAEGIIEALNEYSARKLIVVRMMGTNEKEGTSILRRAGITTCSDAEEAIAEVLKVR